MNLLVNKFKAEKKEIRWESNNKYTWSVNTSYSILYYPDFKNNYNKIKQQWNSIKNNDYDTILWDYSFRFHSILCHEIWHIYQDDYVPLNEVEWGPSVSNFITWFEINRNAEKSYIYQFLLYHYNLLKSIHFLK